MNFDFNLASLLPVALCIFLLGMSKGGFPIGSVALPLLILIWPGTLEPAKEVVAFMLPLLCCMDIFAVCFYRRHIQWRRILPLIPGSLIGVLIGSLFFVSAHNAILSVSDGALRILIGIIGILFVAYRLARQWLLRKLPATDHPAQLTSTLFGGAAGITSTVAHAAGPLAQIYYLMQDLPKMQLAATMAGYFFGLNLVKLIPFILLGRLESQTLLLGTVMLPVVPLGVGAGYLIVRALKSHWYIAFIHAILLATSVILIWSAIGS